MRSGEGFGVREREGLRRLLIDHLGRHVLRLDVESNPELQSPCEVCQCIHGRQRLPVLEPRARRRGLSPGPQDRPEI